MAVPPVPLKIRLPPDTWVLLMTGCEGAVTTFTKPKLFNCDMSHAKPAPGVAGIMPVNKPE